MLIIRFCAKMRKTLMTIDWGESTISLAHVSQMLQSVDDDEKALYTIYRVDGITHKAWFTGEKSESNREES